MTTDQTDGKAAMLQASARNNRMKESITPNFVVHVSQPYNLSRDEGGTQYFESGTVNVQTFDSKKAALNYAREKCKATPAAFARVYECVTEVESELPIKVTER